MCRLNDHGIKYKKLHEALLIIIESVWQTDVRKCIEIKIFDTILKIRMRLAKLISRKRFSWEASSRWASPKDFQSFLEYEGPLSWIKYFCTGTQIK